MTCDRCGCEDKDIKVTDTDRKTRLNSKGKKVFSPFHDLRKCICTGCQRVFFTTTEFTAALEYDETQLKTYIVVVGKPSFSDPLEQNRLPFDEAAE